MADISIVDILLAIVGGIFPTFLWLWFWYNQVERPQSRGFLSLLYIVGMIGVFVIIPIDSMILQSGLKQKEYLLAFALVEETFKAVITAAIA